MNKSDLQKILAFFVMCLSFMEAVGATAYLVFDKHYLFAVLNVMMCVLAFPKVKEIVSELFK